MESGVIYRLSKTEDEGKNNGYAFVEFGSPEEYEKAIQYCQREPFRGHFLDVHTISSILENDSVVVCNGLD